MKKILMASPLFILRRECAGDLFAVLDKIGALGFDGVEFLGFFGKTAQSVRQRMADLRMAPVGNHVNYNEFAQDTDGVIDFHQKAGCRYITVGGIPGEMLPGTGGFSEAVRQLTRIGRACRGAGLTLLYHNHAFELAQKVNGKYMLEAILDETPEDCLAFEPDLGWMAIGGADPAYFLDKYKSRCPVIHLKDFYASDISKIGDPGDLDEKRGTAERGHFEFRPVGYGVANIPGYINRVLDCSPEWIVMDHDLAYGRDSFDDLKLSLSYTRNLIAL